MPPGQFLVVRTVTANLASVAALRAGASAVLAASIFHRGEVPIAAVKEALSAADMEVRR